MSNNSKKSYSKSSKSDSKSDSESKALNKFKSTIDDYDSKDEKILSHKITSVKENSDDSDLTKQFKRLLNVYLSNLIKFNTNINPELEVRFGTKKIKSISRIDFYNVIKNLISNNFTKSSENYYLKILLDNEMSNIRTQISGFPNIKNYCNYNNISNIEDEKNLEFVEKKYFNLNEKTLYPVDFDDFNFRVSFLTEKQYNKTDTNIQNIINNWTNIKKIFRYIRRFEFKHPDLPVLIHCSIVKTSKTHNNKFVPEFTIKDANVFNSLEHYEIEIEIDNAFITMNSKYNKGLDLYNDVKKTIKYVLSGLQQTNFPISIEEQSTILFNYIKLIKNKEIQKDVKKDEYLMKNKITPKDFIGPSSMTLQIDNILNSEYINTTNKHIPNIRNNYTVTDKADGMRKLLFINNDGKIYLITSTVNIEFTGCYSENKDLFNTIIDGEHILHDKNGEYINLYAAFDLYYINEKNVTGLPFINIDKTDEDKKEATNYRLVLLTSVINKLNLQSIIPNKKPSLTVNVKKFYASNIFQGCAKILDNVNKGLYNYNTDGLIFTPANTGVASNSVGKIAPN